MIVKMKIDSQWSNKQKKGLSIGLLENVTDVDRRAAIIAPKDSRNLVNSKVIEKLGEFAYRIKYGSSRVPYARKRYFENKKNPGSLKWLEKGADSVARGDYGKYYRGKA